MLFMRMIVHSPEESMPASTCFPMSLRATTLMASETSDMHPREIEMERYSLGVSAVRERSQRAYKNK
jgi:hypothetical protein